MLSHCAHFGMQHTSAAAQVHRGLVHSQLTEDPPLVLTVHRRLAACRVDGFGTQQTGSRLEVDALERGPYLMVLVLVVGVHIAADGPAEQDGLLRDGRDAAAHILRRSALQVRRVRACALGKALEEKARLQLCTGRLCKRPWSSNVTLHVRHLCLSQVSPGPQALAVLSRRLNACAEIQTSLDTQFLRLWLNTGTPMQTMCNVKG